MDSRLPLKEDLARAYFCSEAVLFDLNKDIQGYLDETKLKFPIIHFDVVHVSVDKESDPPGFKFLVAYAADAIFIAFRGSRNFEDLGMESQSESSAGEVHEKVLLLYRNFMGSDCNLFARLKCLEKRIIFCGHRLGGSVAHMVVVRFFKDFEVKTENLKSDTMISFAFGAPNICGEKCAQEINGNADLKVHFFTVLDKCDPLASLQDGLEGHEAEGNSDGIWGMRFRAQAVQKISTALVVATKNVNRIIDYRQLKLLSVPAALSPSCNESDPQASMQDGLERHEVKGDSSGRWERRFPIGVAVQLPGRCPQSSSSSILGSCGREQFLGKYQSWNRERFGDHYKSVVIAESELSSKASEDANSPKTKVDSPAPNVVSAKWKASDYKIFITIEGYNLLFLREPVILDGLHKWETVYLRTNSEFLSELVIIAPDKTKADVIKALSTVTLKTSFGATTKLVQQDIDGDTAEIPLRVLPRIVQTFFVLASPPFSGLPSTETLQNLDNIIQCVPGLKDKKLSQLLRNTAGVSVETCSEDLKTYANEMNEVVDLVIAFLSQSYIIDIPQYKQSLLYVGLVKLPMGAMALAKGAEVTMAASVAGTGALIAGGDGSIMALVIGKGRLMVRQYTDMLQLAISEASLWYKTEVQPKAASDCKPTTAELESLLQKEVERSGSHLEKMILEIHKSAEADIELRSEALQPANVKSKHNLVRRMHIVAKTVALYNNEVRSTEFLGIVGAEDAGKSTFIKKAIRRFVDNPLEEVPKVGLMSHTTTVRPYKLKGSFYLVDFPGSDGAEKYAEAWKQFTSLPSSCILLFDFKGDLKKHQMKMYKKMKKDLDSKVAVVFNKVDLLFSDSEEDKFDADYLKMHRKKTAQKLGCNSEDVYYVCLKPRNDEIFTELQKMGVLDFGGLAKKVGCWLAKHSGPGSHNILMEELND